MPWPTKSRRPIRRATFGRAATIDDYVHYLRASLRARELGQIDHLLHHRQANPYRRKKAAAAAYDRGFADALAASPYPKTPPLPDIPRARNDKRNHPLPIRKD